ncbi:winged helix-turn-helix transcriptional regulator [Sinomicrobium oceani]|uniref:winged helix-turn-helix transcriptional regulator n=1 Tax=Sinomicrobium oceani TaxID=1150368 RepID=UPI001C31B8D3
MSKTVLHFPAGRCVSREVPGITDKTLSKELKFPKANLSVSRKVYASFPPKIESCITPHMACHWKKC